MAYYQAINSGERDIELVVPRDNTPLRGNDFSPFRVRSYGDHFITNPQSPIKRPQRASGAIDGDDTQYTRMVDRDGAMFQSNGKLYVKKKIQQKDWWTLYRIDWFHSIINAPTSRIIVCLLFTYVSVVFAFAAVYYLIHPRCGLNFTSFVGAFDFSLETMATIGYSTKDIFFHDCISVCIVLTLQVCTRIIVDAVTIGIIYCRLARPHSRASTLIFSEKAIIRRIRGKLYFMFQLCELRKHQLVNAHVRLYLLKKEIDPDCDLPNHAYLQTCSMRLNHPNDELGGMLLLMLPQLVVHELDATSPLMPPAVWHSTTGEIIKWNPPVYREYYRQDAKEYDPEVISALDFPNVSRRGSDIGISTTAMQQSLSTIPSELCEDKAGDRHAPLSSTSVLAAKTPVKAKNHIQNNLKTPMSLLHVPPANLPDLTVPGRKDDFSSGGVEREKEFTSPGLMKFSEQHNNDHHHHEDGNGCILDDDLELEWQRLEREMIQRYIRERQIEVIAIVEGSDSATGGNVQARHSYVYSEVTWNKAFNYCLFADPEDGVVTVDFDRFHQLRDVAKDAAYAGPIPSCI